MSWFWAAVAAGPATDAAQVVKRWSHLSMCPPTDPGQVDRWVGPLIGKRQRNRPGSTTRACGARHAAPAEQARAPRQRRGRALPDRQLMLPLKAERR